jgi:hypothetical protein
MKYRHVASGLTVETDRQLDWPYEPVDVADDAEAGQVAAYRHTGGGWYEVTFQDGSIERVRGRDSLEALL